MLKFSAVLYSSVCIYHLEVFCHHMFGEQLFSIHMINLCVIFIWLAKLTIMMKLEIILVILVVCSFAKRAQLISPLM